MTKLEEVATAIANILGPALAGGSPVKLIDVARAALEALKDPPEEVRDVLCKACLTYCFDGCDCGGVWNSGLDAILNEAPGEPE